jgi:ribosome-binding factor A
MIRTQVRDPRVGVVTVTATDTAGDIGSTKVYVRILGDDNEVRETLAGLEAAAPFLRHQLGQILRLRKVPELRFREDRSMDHARRIEEILSDVIPDEALEPSADADSADPDSEAPEDLPSDEV